MRTVGLFEAKTHLSALVEAAARGERIIVTRNGKPVAQIGPVRLEAELTREEALEGLFAIRDRIRARGDAFTADEIVKLIDEGHRF